MKIPQFNDIIIKLLNVRLKKFKDKNLDLVLCSEAYQTIFNTLIEVFKTQLTLTNESMNYLAQQYYDNVLINDKEELNPNIFTQRVKVENINTKDLMLMVVLLNRTDFVVPLIKEVKRRN